MALFGKEVRLLDPECFLPTSLLAELDLRRLSMSPQQLVLFKPVDGFGSRGMLVGEKISRKRFDQLPVTATLAQELVPPSLTEVVEQGAMKRIASLRLSKQGARCDRSPVPGTGNEHAYPRRRFCPRPDRLIRSFLLSGPFPAAFS